MVYLSLFLLNFQHQDIINKQKQLKKDADENWVKFQNKINPQLLYQSLETLIGLVHHKHKEAEILLAQLSNIYRKILDFDEDIIELEKELELVEAFSQLVCSIFSNNVSI